MLRERPEDPIGGKSFLVTGGCGFIGSHTVEALLFKGAERVRVLDDLSSGQVANLPADPRVEFIKGSILDQMTVRAALDGVSAVVHLAAQVSVQESIRDPVRSLRTNIEGFLNVVEGSVAMGVPRVVYASSAAAYGDLCGAIASEEAASHPLSPYGVEKHTNEAYAKMYGSLRGLSCLGLRYFNVYGPRQSPTSQYAGVISKFIHCVVRGAAPVVFGDGRQVRDFIYVKDVARINAEAATGSVRGVLNVATGRSTSLLQLIEVIERELGTRVDLRFEPARAGDIRASIASVDRMNATFPGMADTQLEEGLRELISWTLCSAADEKAQR